VSVALLAGSATASAALPRKGGRYFDSHLPSLGDVRGETGLGLYVAGTGRRLRASLPAMCGRNPRGEIPKIRISVTGRFSGKRNYTWTASNGEKFAWKLRISGRFTSRKRAKGVMTIHLETSDYNRGENPPRPGVEHVCQSPRNMHWTATLFQE
jgi:hypothetical protein